MTHPIVRRAQANTQIKPQSAKWPFGGDENDKARKEAQRRYEEKLRAIEETRLRKIDRETENHDQIVADAQELLDGIARTRSTSEGVDTRILDREELRLKKLLSAEEARHAQELARIEYSSGIERSRAKAELESGGITWSQL